MDYWNLNDEIDLDELIDEIDIDETFDAIARRIEEEDSKTAIVNPGRLGQLMQAYELINEVVRGSGVRVSYRLHEPFKSTGDISITGKSIWFSDTKRFMEAVRLASNFEAYPRNDKTIRIAMAFDGLTNPIEND